MVDVLIDLIGQAHDATDGPAVITRFVMRRDFVGRERQIRQVAAEAFVEMLIQ